MTSAATRHRAQVIELTVLGHAAAGIAERVRLSIRQVRRYLAEPAVRSQIRELEDERLRAVARKAAALGGSAVMVLASIANDTKQPAAARVSAARALLDAMLKVGELADLSERLTALEERLAATPAGEGAPAWRHTA
jgi:hypothetical protein